MFILNLIFLHCSVFALFEVAPEYTIHNMDIPYKEVTKIDYSNDIHLYWDNPLFLNYSDAMYTVHTPANNSFEGLCGPVHANFETNSSFMNCKLSYYSNCNLSTDIFWIWSLSSLCNSTSTVCVSIKKGDIFHIHKHSYSVYDIQDTLLIYEQIAYIFPEFWIIGIFCMFLCCFGVYSYNVAGSKIVT